LKKISQLEQSILESVNLKKNLITHEYEINKSINIICKSINKGGKIFLCGNGGSAADAQHLAAEFVVRLRPNFNRKGIPAISLSSDTSIITACANDYGFKKVFSRSLQALYKKNDILIAISTSGNSENIIEVLKFCKKNNITSIALLGSGGGRAKKLSNTSIIINSKITARIQEMHIFLGHFIFESAEDLIFSKNKNKKNKN
jgi:D-sedoheptulose 7-phosphate isomerase|tara:strand:- start:15244 stop:15849 length:606 start_codon:yes stop_codon:yes gene_type:complete